jgi:hypothetical protein
MFILSDVGEKGIGGMDKRWEKWCQRRNRTTDTRISNPLLVTTCCAS